MNLDLSLTDERIRDGIELLRQVSSNRAFDPDERKTIGSILADFDSRINNVKVNLGIIGEFNSGKSTLINSIMGKKVSATGDRPVNAFPVYIRNSNIEKLKIHFLNGEEIVTSLDEKKFQIHYRGKAPEGISTISASVDSTFLRTNGVVLIDTPGVNAINPEHTRITVSVLPEMHAAILLMYSKQPGSKSTIEFLKQVSDQVGKIFICISKSDFLNQEQLSRIVAENCLRD